MDVNGTEHRSASRLVVRQVRPWVSQVETAGWSEGDACLPANRTRGTTGAQAGDRLSVAAARTTLVARQSNRVVVIDARRRSTARTVGFVPRCFVFLARPVGIVFIYLFIMNIVQKYTRK